MILSRDCFGLGNCLRIMGELWRDRAKAAAFAGKALLGAASLRDAEAGLAADRHAGCGGLRGAFGTAGGEGKKG
jgi:hypothetical protein